MIPGAAETIAAAYIRRRRFVNMPPDQIRSLLQQIVVSGSFFQIDPYDLERTKRCYQRGTRFDPLPEVGGIYTIQAKGDHLWAYVGQTHNLRERIQSLQGIFQATEMPYTDPHKAGPSLWAWMQNQPALQLEVSIAPLEDESAYWRQGFEIFVIAWHRWRFACSPCWQFGRMPRGWSASTERKRGMRGQAIEEEIVLGCHLPGIAPITQLFDDQSHPLSEYWAGHHWSPWYWSMKDVPQSLFGSRGMYRLNQKDQLLYLGTYGIGLDKPDEEEIGGDLYARMPMRARATSLPRIFQEARKQGAAASFVSGSWKEHEVRELWSDAVALYLLRQHSLPLAQFAGDKKQRHLSRLRDPLRYLSAWLPPRELRSPFPLAG